MEQQQRSLIFTAAVGLIILAIIIGSIYYLVKFIQGRVATSRQTTQTSEQATPTSDPSNGVFVNPDGTVTEIPTPQTDSNPSAQTTPSDKKVYNAGAFQLVYPNNWGVLSCSNSSNLEFDPTNASDNKANCDFASKPVTIVMGDSTGCAGETVKLGNVDVTKTKVNDGSYTKYQWCTKTEPMLNITHRVSPDGERATSKEDYSNQIEQMISNLSFVRGS